MTAFETILVANRGEIARRVAASAHGLGYRVAAVFTEADAEGAWVAEADAAICIGAGPVADSYLSSAKLLDAAQRMGADAVHPGYGFLSENADFARAVIAAGMVWIGPSPEAIEVMGDKARARQLMAASGVPLVPGYDSDDQGDEALAAAADSIGYPLLVKAVAGGGGRGMRRVDSAEDLTSALAGARREAGGAFGNDRLLLEKLVEDARHIEIQVMGDTHGAVIHLGERDCSVQRRYQKVLEEAPAVSSELRERMGAAAIAAAKAVDYVGAGTVEFLVGKDDAFYFLEMNTRLQVEHPVTEAVWGRDLVGEQIEIAAGAVVRPAGKRPNGHAIEVRLYAEDPYVGYLPQSGRIAAWEPPENARTDHALAAGQVVSDFYDPMVAKLIVHGRDREDVRRRLLRALDQTVLLGLRTNRAFLQRVIAHPDFVANTHSTRWLEEQEWPAPEPSATDWAIVAALWLGDAKGWRSAGDPTFPLDLTMPMGSSSVGNETVTLWIDPPANPARDGWTVRSGEQSKAARLIHWTGGRARVEVDGVQRTVLAQRDEHGLHLDMPALTGTVVEAVHAGAGAAAVGNGVLTAHIAGAVVAVEVAVGDSVALGDRAVVLEAMKIESPILCDITGTVREVRVKSGDRVDRRAILVVIEAAESPE
ncbi:MAG: geranyl-CoA carboxylase alpha subunit [Myxococcota bacterium]|jgi:geranyl-CoA carboxylase alpha subunit